MYYNMLPRRLFLYYPVNRHRCEKLLIKHQNSLTLAVVRMLETVDNEPVNQIPGQRLKIVCKRSENKGQNGLKLSRFKGLIIDKQP